MSAKKIISDKLKSELVSFVDHHPYVKMKLELAISCVNIGCLKQLTPYEIFLLGKELSRALTLQGETSTLKVSENEIAVAISEVECLLKYLREI